jgi:hypothetical protein
MADISDQDAAVLIASEGHLELAADLLRAALQADPNDQLAARNLGLVVLAQGDYREGAQLYEARFETGLVSDPGLPFPRWRGEPIDGKRVLIWPEQGFGDQIMFARFVPQLQRRGCDVTLICPPNLEQLFRQSLDVRVVAASGAVEFPDPDVWLWSSSLLAASGATIDTLPSAPYLRAEPIDRRRGRIGVVTRGSPSHGNDQHRSLPDELAWRLREIEGALSLAPADSGARSMAETASIVAGLDLVITVDTSVAHLAGALGKPVWILLPAYGTDWRWLRDRADTPWYPTARLFRQRTKGDWAPVVAEVTAALAQLSAATSG